MHILFFIVAFVTTYAGRVVDQNGQPVTYATVYPEIAPEWGTATNNDGFFSFEANLTRDSRIVFSFIGFEKKVVLAEDLQRDSLVSDSSELAVIVLNEQPIALEETVISAKASKQKNKRKQMIALLQAVYEQLDEEFPQENMRYQVVSDVRMQNEGSTWGMEQMIANIVVLPEQGAQGRDSVQFQGRFCKRFFDAHKRAQADSILAGEALERLDKKGSKDMPKGTPKHFMRRAMNAVDSGVVVHRALFSMGNMRYDFAQAMNDVNHWTVSNESEGETVLTHTQKVIKYLGFYQMTMQRHYIVDSYSFAVLRFSEHAEVKVTIPFGMKMDADQLQMLNLINMDEQQIEKFRLKKINCAVDLNTIYQRSEDNGKVYILEKNMLVNGKLLGSKKMEVPLVLKATQRVTGLQTQDVQPLSRSQITRRLKREIVEIY